MIRVHLIEADGRRFSIEGKSGRSLMRTAVDAGVSGIAADCGGCLTCATCHVIVDDAWAEQLPPPTADEQAMLEMTAAARAPGSRLSCQIILSAALNGLVVQLPDRQY